MEAVWFYAWVMVLTPPDSTYPTFGAIVALIVMAALLGRASASLPWRRPRNHLLLLPVSLVVLPVWLLAVLGRGKTGSRAAGQSAPQLCCAMCSRAQPSLSLSAPWD